MESPPQFSSCFLETAATKMKSFGLLVFVAVLCFSSGFGAQTLFQCGFEDGTCGFINLPNTSGQFVRKYIGGLQGHVLVLENNFKNTVSGTTQSPFIQVGRTADLCLSYDLYLAGQAADITTTMKHSTGFWYENKWVKNTNFNVPWRRLHMNRRIVDSAKILFQANAQAGKVAIDNIVVKVGGC